MTNHHQHRAGCSAGSNLALHGGWLVFTCQDRIYACPPSGKAAPTVIAKQISVIPPGSGAWCPTLRDCCGYTCLAYEPQMRLRAAPLQIWMLPCPRAFS